MIPRLHYLRGILAFSIMLHHYFNYWEQSASSALGRLGLYGVSMFYILSGITLYHVYHKHFSFDKKSLSRYFIKRVARIYPLFILATLLTLFLMGNEHEGFVLLLNFTGLFGFVGPDLGIVQGAWSIGNELVFYFIFPLFLFLLNRDRSDSYALTFGVFVLLTSLSIYYMNPGISLNDQWENYVNPINQMYLFVGGILIGHGFRNRSFSPLVTRIGFWLSVGLFFLLPFQGDLIHLVSGYPRILFSTLCFAICAVCYINRKPLPKRLHSTLHHLGSMSYSIYLLHPVVYVIVVYVESLFFEQFSKLYLACISIPLTLIVSHFSYKWFETFFVKLARSKTR